MILADLHVHSTFSDGQMTIAELVDFYGSRGFGAIAITDHLCETNALIGKAARIIGHTLTEHTFSIYLRTLEEQRERAWKQYRMVLIGGVEITQNRISNHRSAHILGLGIEKWINPNGDVVDIAKSIQAQGGLAIAAHPVSTRKIEKQTYHLWDRRKELRHVLDGWEVASGRHWFDEVAKEKLPVIATSDLHRADQIDSWKTVFTCEKHPEAILTAIRRQDIDFHYYLPVSLSTQVLSHAHR